MAKLLNIHFADIITDSLNAFTVYGDKLRI